MKRFAYLITLLLLAPLAAYAGDSIYTGEGNNVAINGYDPVAYFTQGEPMEGSPEYSTQWRGAEWHFANAEHLARFRENPEQYAPAYGGHCAFGAVQGKALASSPEYWTIEDGRLFLNLNEEVHGKWVAEKEENIEVGDRKWQQIKTK